MGKEKKDTATMLYEADQKVQKFAKSKDNNFSEDDYKKFSGLLEKRAEAITNVLGVKVSSISYEDAKEFREKNKK